tara:strand:- start:330 stop:491 length:162 start_codon:yes stop_codon:yes gene_type:complete
VVVEEVVDPHGLVTQKMVDLVAVENGRVELVVQVYLDKDTLVAPRQRVRVTQL